MFFLHKNFELFVLQFLLISEKVNTLKVSTTKKVTNVRDKCLNVLLKLLSDIFAHFHYLLIAVILEAFECCAITPKSG